MAPGLSNNPTSIDTSKDIPQKEVKLDESQLSEKSLNELYKEREKLRNETSTNLDAFKKIVNKYIINSLNSNEWLPIRTGDVMSQVSALTDQWNIIRWHPEASANKVLAWSTAHIVEKEGKRIIVVKYGNDKEGRQVWEVLEGFEKVEDNFQDDSESNENNIITQEEINEYINKKNSLKQVKQEILDELPKWKNNFNDFVDNIDKYFILLENLNPKDKLELEYLEAKINALTEKTQEYINKIKTDKDEQTANGIKDLSSSNAIILTNNGFLNFINNEFENVIDKFEITEDSKLLVKNINMTVASTDFVWDWNSQTTQENLESTPPTLDINTFEDYKTTRDTLNNIKAKLIDEIHSSIPKWDKSFDGFLEDIDKYFNILSKITPNNNEDKNFIEEQIKSLDVDKNYILKIRNLKNKNILNSNKINLNQNFIIKVNKILENIKEKLKINIPEDLLRSIEYNLK